MEKSRMDLLLVRFGIRALQALLVTGAATVLFSLFNTVSPYRLVPSVAPSTTWAVCAVLIPIYFPVIFIGIWGEKMIQSPSVFFLAAVVVPLAMWGTFTLIHQFTGMGTTYGKIVGISLVAVGVFVLWVYVKDSFLDGKMNGET